MALQIGAMYMGTGGSPKQFARAVERAGFDSVWAGDHLLGYVDGIAALATLAASTDRITVGSNVLILPFRPAAVTAKGVLTAAAIAGPDRRTIMGAGVGGDVPDEFALCGADVKTRGRFADEALEVITRLWTGEPVGFHGRWNSFQNAVMSPSLERAPEIWIGGRSEGALRRALRFGSGYIPYLVSPAQCQTRYDRLRELASTSGRSNELPDGFTLAATTFMLPAPSREQAAELAAVAGGFRNVGRDNIGNFYVLGNASECVARLDEYRRAGAEHIVIGCAPGHSEPLANFIAASKEILPALREKAAADKTR